jgi:hypothetical protein
MSCQGNATFSNPPTVAAFMQLYGAPVGPVAQGIMQKYGNGKSSFSSSGSSFLETVVRRNASAAQTANYNGAIAMLCARGFLYTTGCNCFTCFCPGAGQPVPVNSGGAAGVKLGAAAAGAGIAATSFVSSVGGASSLGFAAAGTVAGTALGAATLGLGLLVGPLLALIQHHAQAVAAQQGAVCSVVNAVNSTIPQIDYAVQTGSITPQQGITAIQSFATQMKQALAPTSGVGDSTHPCNGSCVWQSFIQMQADFAGTYYMDISPVNIRAANPGAFTPQVASAGTTLAAVNTMMPPPGSPTANGSPTAAGANNPGSGTFTSVQVIPAAGIGVGTPAGGVTAAPSPLLILALGGLALWGAIAFFGK